LDCECWAVHFEERQVKMPHSYGYRARTRDMFSRDFRTKGHLNATTYLTVYKRGDFVDIKCNPMIHKGMPFKHYHGRTGVVFNVTPRALGVIVNKEVNGKIIKKRINVRVEHVKPSKCQKENKGRALINDTIKRSVRGEELHAKHQRCYESLPQDVKQSIMNKERVNLVRTPIQPRKGYICKLDEELTTIQPAPFSDLV